MTGVPVGWPFGRAGACHGDIYNVNNYIHMIYFVCMLCYVVCYDVCVR